MATTIRQEESSDTSLAEFRSDVMDSATWHDINCSLCHSVSENSAGTTNSFYSSSNYVIASVYWVIFVVGVSGNLLVVAVVIWKLVKSPQRQAMTIFVGSLAVSDLGLLLWVTWVNAILSVNPEWFSGKLLCKMHTLWRSLTAECSIATLMFIALDRYV